MEPLMVAAGAIAKLAFDEFVKAGAGEAAKKSLGGAIELVKDLRGKIRAKLSSVDLLYYSINRNVVLAAVY